MSSPAESFIIEAFTLLAIAVLFVALRTVSRLMSVGIKQFQLDDYLMIFVIILYGLETGAAYTVVEWFYGYANSGMTPSERKNLATSNPEYYWRQSGSKVQVIGWNLYTLLLWSLKVCMCVFYGRLTNGLGQMTIRIRVGYGLIIGSYFVVMLSILLGCRPLHKNWQIYPDPGIYCQPAISPVNCIVTVVFNVLTDLYLMSIPLPLLWKAQLPIKRKILLLAMFSGGFFVVACGLLRCVLILTDPIMGAAQAGSWAVRETFVSVVIGNLPMVYQLFRRTTKSVTDKVSTHRSRTGGGHIGLSGEDPNGYVGYGQGSKHSHASKKSRFLHPLSLAHGSTFSESQEDLHMQPLKRDECVITTELSVKTEVSQDQINSVLAEDIDRRKTGWVGRKQPAETVTKADDDSV